MKRWPTKPFLKTCDFQGGTQPPKSTFVYKPMPGYIRLIQIRDFEDDDSPAYVLATDKLKTCVESDVMIARYGASIGRILRGKAGAYNVALVKTIPDESQVTRDFLFYWLNSPFFQNYLAKVSSRAAQAGFNKEDFAQLEIPVPPLTEQERIVKLLDEADELRKLRAQADQRTTALIPALFHRMFGDPVTNYLKLSVNKLGSLCSVVGGGTPSKKQRAYWVGKIPWVSPKDMCREEITDSEDHISELAINESATNLIPIGSVLVVTRSGILKHTLPVAMNSVPVAINQDIKAFIPNANCNAIFLDAQLRTASRTILNLVRVGATVQNIETEALRRLSVLCPPLSLQKEFAIRVTEIRTMQAAQAASRKRLDDLFQSMLHRAFNGEL